MIFFKLAAALFGALVLASFVIAAILFRTAFRRNDRENEFVRVESMKKGHLARFAPDIEKGINAFHAAKKEDVYIKSRDGLKLHGYFIPHENARGTIIMTHGWKSRTAFDFSVIWQKYYDMGYNLLGISQRATGRSEGKYVSFGVKEHLDLIDWVKFLNARFGKKVPVIFSGISMGSATVMFAVGNEELPENVVGAIADCGFTSPWEQFCYLLHTRYHLPKFPVLYIAELYAKLLAGFTFRECDARETLKRAKVPMLFIHGEADALVPCSHTLENHAACASRCELLTVKEAEHGMSYLVDRENAESKLTEFLNSLHS